MACFKSILEIYLHADQFDVSCIVFFLQQNKERNTFVKLIDYGMYMYSAYAMVLQQSKKSNMQ